MLGRKWFVSDVCLSDVFIILLLWLNKSLIYQRILPGLQLIQQLPSPLFQTPPALLPSFSLLHLPEGMTALAGKSWGWVG